MASHHIRYWNREGYRYQHLLGTEGGPERFQFGVWTRHNRVCGAYIAVRVRGRYFRWRPCV